MPSAFIRMPTNYSAGPMMLSLFSRAAIRLLGVLLCLLIFAGHSPAGPAPGQEPTAEAKTSPSATSSSPAPAFVLRNFYLSGNETLLTARLSVAISNLGYLQDILRDGARLSIECDSALYRKRTFWRNAQIAERHFASSLRYNPLQKNFILFSENGSPIANADLLALLQSTWGNLEMPLGNLSELEKDETYVAVVSLTLKHEEMPPWLGENVLFWSDTIIPRQEYKLEFEY